MQSKQTMKRLTWVALLALILATASSTMAAPPAQAPDSVVCGDAIYCSTGGNAVFIRNTGTGPSLYGQNTSTGEGLKGRGNPGVFGFSYHAAGIRGKSNQGIGVKGESVDKYGVAGYSTNSSGVYGEGTWAVYGKGMVGVRGDAVSLGAGVWGEGNILSYGVVAYNEENHALWATNGGGPGQAGIFDGDVDVNGTLSKSGGSFKIDHPLDPANQYLYHSFVESPDMMNVYNGNVVLDENGEAWVELPDYFEALNRDYRYQLTAIGAPGPDLYIAEEIADNRFKVAGGQPGAKVSWQVTGIRQDPWANANRIPVEEEKPADEQGYYLHPEVYGQPESMRFRPIPDLQY
jgi:hypothetical protein